jgi:hypothetical protein
MPTAACPSERLRCRRCAMTVSYMYACMYVVRIYKDVKLAMCAMTVTCVCVYVCLACIHGVLHLYNYLRKFDAIIPSYKLIYIYHTHAYYLANVWLGAYAHVCMYVCMSVRFTVVANRENVGVVMLFSECATDPRGFFVRLQAYVYVCMCVYTYIYKPRNKEVKIHVCCRVFWRHRVTGGGTLSVANPRLKKKFAVTF